MVTARGYLYAAALETALKVKETCYLLAEGYSVADLRHGPIAAVTSGIPVLAMAADGPTRADVLSLVSELRERGVTAYLMAQQDRATAPQHDGVTAPRQDPLSTPTQTTVDITLPADTPEWLTPIVATVRGQQLAYQLALVLGHDPDRPSGLSKVTLT